MGLLNLQDKGARINGLRGLFSGYLTDAMEAASGAPDRVGLLAEALANPKEIGRQLANFPPLKRPEGNQMDSELGNLAMNFGASPIAAAGTFIGKGAKTWNALRAAEAEAMEQAGHDPTAIWKQTGTWRGPDKHLRQEIDDQNANSITKMPKGGGAFWGRIKDALSHEDLFSAYPDLADRPFMQMKGPGYPDEAWGRYTPSTDSFQQGADSKSTLIHELQHAIQEREGFARGGTPAMFGADVVDELRDRLKFQTEMLRRAQGAGGIDPITGQAAHELEALAKKTTAELIPLQSGVNPMEAYRRLAGEAEARATQARMNFSPEHRRAIPPFASYDLPLEQLIVRGNEGGTFNSFSGEKNAIQENAGTYARQDNAGRGGPVQGYPITREQADAINAAKPGSATRRWTRGPDTRGDEGWFMRHGVSPHDETLIYGMGSAPNSLRNAFSPELQAMISAIKADAATSHGLLGLLGIKGSNLRGQR